MGCTMPSSPSTHDAHFFRINEIALCLWEGLISFLEKNLQKEQHQSSKRWEFFQNQVSMIPDRNNRIFFLFKESINLTNAINREHWYWSNYYFFIVFDKLNCFLGNIYGVSDKCDNFIMFCILILILRINNCFLW